jgi:hypothetical protein
MGLDVSHDAWHGAYSAFMRWRTEIARAAGIPLEFMEGFYNENTLSLSLLRHTELKGAAYVPNAAGGMSNAWVSDGVARRASVFPIKWEVLRPDPIHLLLNHSDCDGEIEPGDCAAIADRLTELLPLLPAGDGVGHIGNWAAKTQAFIDGCRAAADAGEQLRFR